MLPARAVLKVLLKPHFVSNDFRGWCRAIFVTCDWVILFIVKPDFKKLSFVIRDV